MCVSDINVNATHMNIDVVHVQGEKDPHTCDMLGGLAITRHNSDLLLVFRPEQVAY